MRKTIYILFTASLLCLLAACSSSEKTAPLPERLQGAWKLASWDGVPAADLEAYISFNTDNSFEILLQTSETYLQKYSGRYMLTESTLVGTYTDGAWEDSYEIKADRKGNQLSIKGKVSGKTGTFTRMTGSLPATTVPFESLFEGEWQETSPDNSSIEPETYMSFDGDGAFVIYRQAMDNYYQKETGGYDVSGTALSGKILTARGTTYTALFDKAGETLALTRISDGKTISYVRTTIPSSVKNPSLLSQIDGEWALTTWNGSVPQDFMAYLVFNGGAFEIYQQIEQTYYEKYTGSYTITGTGPRTATMSGTYSDSSAWGSTYNVEIDQDGNTFTMTSTTNVSEVSIYTRTPVPSSVKDGAVTKQETRSSGFRLL
ncbi:lipocalin family protein [uncultured Alistipes sp.]|jgi:hypothetical protein|uniref:lipocalin family protein n=1 Tax=uncultured Alistipes sp. TaxID=538949 RepID=UPI0025F11079|nr:lipocalin family protein [uncultured Alistipes sp.]